jgi:hypothetical protein
MPTWQSVAELRPGKTRKGRRCWTGRLDDGRIVWAFPDGRGGFKLSSPDPWSGHHGVAREIRDDEIEAADAAMAAMERDRDG